MESDWKEGGTVQPNGAAIRAKGRSTRQKAAVNRVLDELDGSDDATPAVRERLYEEGFYDRQDGDDGVC